MLIRGGMMRNLLGARLGSMWPPVAQGLDCSAQIRCLSATTTKAEVDKGDVFPITGIKKPTKGLFMKYPNESTAWYAHLTSVSIPFHERYVNLLKRTQRGTVPKQRAVLELLGRISTQKEVKSGALLIKQYLAHLGPKLRKDTGTLLLHGAIRAGDAFDEAMEILRTHRDYRFLPSATAVLDLMKALGKAGRTSDVFKAHKILVASNPQQKSFWKVDFLYAMARPLLTDGEYVKVAECFATFRENGETPDKCAYRLALSGCLKACEEGKADEATAALSILEGGMSTDKVSDEVCKDLVIKIKQAAAAKPADKEAPAEEEAKP